MANQNNPQFVITGKVRLSYVHLFAPYVNRNSKDGKAKYSATILLPKSDVATKQRIDAAIQAAKQVGTAGKWGGIMPPIVSTPVHDGNGVRPSDGMPFGDECKDHWVFAASSDNRPDVVDVGVNPIMNQSEVYSGVYARVSVQFYPYNSGGKKGVGCGLGNVQKLEDGEPLGGRTSAADDFSDVYAPAPPVQQYYQPMTQPYQQPVQPYQQPMQSYQQPVQPYQQYGQPVQSQPLPGYGAQLQPQQVQTQYDPVTGQPIVGGVLGI